MGNCLSPASKRSHSGMLPEEEQSLSEMRRISQLLLLQDQEEEDDYARSEEEEEPAAAAAAAPATAPEGLKVKIVLTRGELEWLMAQLKSGHQRLDDVLQHMQTINNAGAAAAGDKAGWRPRLESIIECPETTTVS